MLHLSSKLSNIIKHFACLVQKKERFYCRKRSSSLWIPASFQVSAIYKTLFSQNTAKPAGTFLRVLSRLGYKDSNLEMTESESVALPFGDSPLTQQDVVYTMSVR
jgi:hypothetical protein